MSKQVVCYVQRKLIADWKRKVITHFERAFVYGSRDRRVFAKLEKGDVLWIVSPVQGRPPELVARLEIEGVAPLGCGSLPIAESLELKFSAFDYLALGGPASVFFGHNNAGPALMQTTFVNPTSRLQWRLSDRSADWKPEYGSRFIRPFEVALPESGISHFDLLAQSPPVFLSWKQRDHEPGDILSLAYALADQGLMPWLDLLALPASKSLKVAQKRSQELTRLLEYGYQHSEALLVVESEHYGEKSDESDENWTQREWDGTFSETIPLERFIYLPQTASPCATIPATHPRLSSRTHDQAALELRGLLSHSD
ncbi:MAG: hypothetical protein ACOYYU_12340 [Chloroflexota bacterium]